MTDREQRGHDMAHDYHEDCPGYSPAQILHDGCGECESHGWDVPLAISHMDKGRFAEAWKRAADWNQTTDVRDVSHAERSLLEVLWAIQLKLESVCGVPIGELPQGLKRDRG
jgi:hypothetical protein